MTVDLHLIDTFTSSKFKGNPTPVCFSEAPIDERLMLSIAKELNQPVTVFIDTNRRGNAYPLYYFTVKGQIPACGHATLAAAKLVSEIMTEDNICFITVEDIRIRASAENGLIFLTYPKYEPVACRVEGALLHALGLSEYKSSFFCKELESLFIEVGEPKTLIDLNPDFEALVRSNGQLKEVVVTSVSHDQDYDFLLRSFCPWIGINEDPVTGSVHSILAHFWKNRLHKKELKAYQASERGGEAYVKAHDDRVELGGAAVTVMKGALDI